MLQTMQPFFILSRCSLITTFLIPAEKQWVKKKQKTGEKKLIKNNILIVLFKKKSINHRMTAVTCAGDDHVYMSDYFTQFNYSEAIHAEWSGG